LVCPPSLRSTLIFADYSVPSGRTGRIGFKGIASSFYNEKDEGLASVLTRTLLETKQEIPDFLEQYRPEGDAATKLVFEEDSDFEDAAGEEEGGDAWGADGDDDAEDGGGGGWGAAGDDAKAEEPAADDW
jgi:ATP-dependent RNA helicase DDX3X